MNEFDYIRENAERIIYEAGEAKAKYRSPNDVVDIMAVTKTVSPEAVNVAVQSGITLPLLHMTLPYLVQDKTVPPRSNAF